MLCAMYLNYFIVIFCICLNVHSFAIPKPQEKTKRIFENNLSDEKHYIEEDEHNVDYDHEAFLGEDRAQSFNDLTPEESKKRLGKIVDEIDSDKNGFVTLQELKNWIEFIQKRYVVEDSNRQWASFNTDKQGTLTWEEYKKASYGITDDDDDVDNKDDTNDVERYTDMIDRDSRRWKQADMDGDGKMSLEEFMDFLHPEEAEHMKDIVVMETMEDLDKDKDGKISLDEYIGDMYGNDVDKDEDPPDWIDNEKDQFSQYRDKNNDGYMDFGEVKKWVLPDDYDNSEAEAKHLVYESDANRDNQLSKDEILDKYDLFVGSQATDYGEALARHDEF